MKQPLILDFQDLSLHMGNIDNRTEKDGNIIYSITPPEKTLFDQLFEYLDQKPLIKTDLYNPRIASIGATSLCFRLGTWMGWLTSDPKTKIESSFQRQVSLINDTEMNRMNIEASYNVARLLELFFTDEGRAIELLRKAYIYLPLDINYRTSSKSIVGKMAVAIIAICLQNDGVSEKLNPKGLFRKMSNLLANTIYRNNSPLENLHASEFVTTYEVLNCRRLNRRQSNSLFRYIVDQFEPLFQYSLWNDGYKALNIEEMPFKEMASHFNLEDWAFIYPNGWTLTESASDIVIYEKAIV